MDRPNLEAHGEVSVDSLQQHPPLQWRRMRQRATCIRPHALPDLASRDSAYGTVFPMMLDLGLPSRGGIEQWAEQSKNMEGVLYSSTDH